MADLAETLAQFEGLVFATSRMFAAQVRREEDDLAQELRVRVWRAVQTYDPAKSSSTLERYVFSAVTNKVKDFKRDAAREARRRERYGVAFVHIEDTIVADAHMTAAERFDQLHHHVSAEVVYAEVESEPFAMPLTVTERERHVLALLVWGNDRNEIARRLGEARSEVDEMVRSLRLKFADWRPTPITLALEHPAVIALAVVAA